MHLPRVAACTASSRQAGRRTEKPWHGLTLYSVGATMAGSRYRVLEKPSQAFYGLDDNNFFVYLLSLTVNLARAPFGSHAQKLRFFESFFSTSMDFS